MESVFDMQRISGGYDAWSNQYTDQGHELVPIFLVPRQITECRLEFSSGVFLQKRRNLFALRVETQHIRGKRMVNL